jgi:prepilin-type N-terminal cleavage/methylation domain-containing protein
MLTKLSNRIALGGEGGFTLVEMIATIAVLSALMAMFAELLSVTVTRSGRSQEQSTLQTEARAALDTFASDLRQALCNNTTAPVTTASATQLTFTSPDRLTPYHLRQVSYRLSGGNFQVATATSTNTGGPPWTLPALGPWTTLVGSVTNTSVFTYYDASTPPAVTTTPASVARADLSLSITPFASPGDGATTFSQSVNLRTPTC